MNSKSTSRSPSWAYIFVYVKHDYKFLYRSLDCTWSLERRANHDLPYQKQLIGPTLNKSVSSLIQSQTQFNLDPYY